MGRKRMARAYSLPGIRSTTCRFCNRTDEKSLQRGYAPPSRSGAEGLQYVRTAPRTIHRFSGVLPVKNLPVWNVWGAAKRNGMARVQHSVGDIISNAQQNKQYYSVTRLRTSR